MTRRVVVTGCGLVSCLGLNKDQNFKALAEGQSGIDKITQFDASLFNSRIAGEIKNFNPADYLPLKDIKRIARFVQVAIAASREAVSESGLDASKEDPYRVGVIVGSGIGSLQCVEEQHGLVNTANQIRIVTR